MYPIYIKWFDQARTRGGKIGSLFFAIFCSNFMKYFVILGWRRKNNYLSEKSIEDNINICILDITFSLVGPFLTLYWSS